MKIIDYIANYISKSVPASIQLRTELVRLKYLEHVTKLKEEHTSLHGHIQQTYLRHSEYCFTENVFPYEFDEYSLHYIIWIHPDFNNKFNIGYSENVVKNEISVLKKTHELTEHIIFENVEQVRSVPGIKHYHVLFYNTD